MSSISNFQINGYQVSNNIQELKQGVTIEQAYQAGQNDGADQIYFSANGKNYVVQGDGLDLSGLKGVKKGTMPYGQVKIGDSIVNVELKVDNEVNTAWEGVKNLKNWMIGEAVLLGGGSAYNLMTLGGKTGEAAMSKAAGFFVLGAAAVGAVGVTAIGGAIYGAARGNEAGLQELIK